MKQSHYKAVHTAQAKTKGNVKKVVMGKGIAHANRPGKINKVSAQETTMGSPTTRAMVGAKSFGAMIKGK